MSVRVWRRKAQDSEVRSWLTSGPTREMPRELHMLESEQFYLGWILRVTLWLGQLVSDPQKSLPGFKSEPFSFLLHTHIYTLITHEIVKRLLERKPWQNTWELKDCIPTIIYTFLLVFHHSHLSNYKSLRGSYPKHFPHPIIVLWVVLVQVGSIGMSHCLANAIGRYCGIRTTSEDKTPRSPLITGAWRAQVHWEVWAKKVYLLSLYPNLFISGSIWLGRPQRDFSSSTSFSLR